jgi:hypothetical protein
MKRINREEVGVGISPEESLAETKELIDLFEESMRTGAPIEIEPRPSLTKGTGIKKQSTITDMKKYYNQQKETEMYPILRVGEEVNDPEHGKGRVIDSSKIRNTNLIVVRFANEKVFDFQGTDEEIFDRLRKGQLVPTDIKPGDILKQDDEEVVVIEKEPGSPKAKVKTPRDEVKEVDVTQLEKTSQKIAQVQDIIFDDFWELGAVPGKKSEIFDDFWRYLNEENPYINKKVLELSVDELKTNGVYEAISRVYDKWKGAEPVTTEIPEVPVEIAVKEAEEKTTRPEDIKIEKTPETEPDEPHEEHEPETDERMPRLFDEIIKSILLEPDVAQRIVEKLVSKIERSPEMAAAIGSKLNEIIPDNFYKSEFLKKSGLDMWAKVVKVIAEAENEINRK